MKIVKLTDCEHCVSNRGKHERLQYIRCASIEPHILTALIMPSNNHPKIKNGIMVVRCPGELVLRNDVRR